MVVVYTLAGTVCAGVNRSTINDAAIVEGVIIVWLGVVNYSKMSTVVSLDNVKLLI